MKPVGGKMMSHLKNEKKTPNPLRCNEFPWNIQKNADGMRPTQHLEGYPAGIDDGR